jgi:hypothetical protein
VSVQEPQGTTARQSIDGRLRYVWSPNMVEPSTFEVVSHDGKVQARGHLRVIGATLLFEPLVPQG